MRPLKIIATLTVIAALLVAGVVGVRRYLSPVVSVTEAVEGPVIHAFYATGTVQPEREFPMRSNTAGTLTKIDRFIDKGDAVKANEIVALTIDPKLQFELEKANAELKERILRADEKTSPVLTEYDDRIKASEAMLGVAQREQKRVGAMVENNAGSQSDLDAAIDRVQTMWSQAESLKSQRAAKLLEMRREAEVAEAAVGVAKSNLELQSLRSPIDGVVLDRPTPIGTRVAINDAILRIADCRPQNLVMRAAVDEEDVARVRVGQTVQMVLYAFPDTTFRGVVTRIYDQANSSNRTFEVDVRFDAPDERLQPGMTGELAFILAEKAKATVIPSQAVQAGAVYAVRNGAIVKLDAAIGVTSIERAEITSGLQPNDKILISPIGTMTEGQSVRTTFVDPATAAGLNKQKAIEAQGASFRNIK